MIQTEMQRIKYGTYRKQYKGQVGHYEKFKICIIGFSEEERDRMGKKQYLKT